MAKKFGVGMIYQELSLAKPISIMENILAGRLPRKGLLLDKRKARLQAEALLKRVGLDLDPSMPIEDISPARGPARGDSQGPRQQPLHPRHGRADERPLPRGGRAALRDHREPQAQGHRDSLHLTPPAGDLQDRRPRHGHARRQEDRHQAHLRGQPRGDRADDGRPIGEGILPPRGAAARGDAPAREGPVPASVSSTA